MTYTVKEIFYTLQGEGAYAGRPAVFLRFSGCNLWSGLERDRGSAICQFCDTDFLGTGVDGGKFQTPDDLASAVSSRWPRTAEEGRRYVVCTGGEPLLQLDAPLIAALKRVGFEIAVETNGTVPVPEGIDWICVSPKAGSAVVQKTGNELKVVFPQEGLDMDELSGLSFGYFRVQPLQDHNYESNVHEAIKYCMAHPKWYLSIQTHKLLGIR